MRSWSLRGREGEEPRRNSCWSEGVQGDVCCGAAHACVCPRGPLRLQVGMDGAGSCV